MITVKKMWGRKGKKLKIKFKGNKGKNRKKWRKTEKNNILQKKKKKEYQLLLITPI